MSFHIILFVPPPLHPTLRFFLSPSSISLTPFYSVFFFSISAYQKYIFKETRRHFLLVDTKYFIAILQCPKWFMAKIFRRQWDFTKTQTAWRHYESSIRTKHIWFIVCIFWGIFTNSNYQTTQLNVQLADCAPLSHYIRIKITLFS